MKNIKEYIIENKENKEEFINVPSEIEKDGIKYELAVSKNYDVIGRKKKGYLAQYIDYKNKKTLIGFEGEDIKDLENKINNYLKNEKYIK